MAWRAIILTAVGPTWTFTSAAITAHTSISVTVRPLAVLAHEKRNRTERNGTGRRGVTDAHVFTHKQAKADTCITKEQCQQVSALALAPGAPAHDCRPATGS